MLTTATRFDDFWPLMVSGPLATGIVTKSTLA
jgi:hypothetical protein